MENKIIMKVCACTKQPNKKGTIFDEEAMKKALKEFNSIPIVDRSCARFADGLDNYSIPNVTVIGMFNEGEYDAITDEITFQGRIFDAGVSYTLDEDGKSINFVEFSLLPPNEKEVK